MPEEYAASVSWIKSGKERETKLPIVAELDQRLSAEPWPFAEFERRLDKTNSHIMAAEIGDRIVGYMLYEVKDSQLLLHKLEVDPEFEPLKIRKQLFQTMVGKVGEHNRRLTVYVREHDTDTQVMLRDELKFQVDKEHPIDRRHYRNGEDAYVLKYEQPTSPCTSLIPYVGISEPFQGFANGSSIIVSSGVQPPPLPDQRPDFLPPADDEADMPSRKEPARLSRAQLLREMNKKLQDLTGGMEWQVVAPDARGRLAPTDIPDNLRDDAKLSFRTAGKVRDPRAAYESLVKYFAARPDRTHAASLDHAAQVVFPAGWVRPIHLELGVSGELASAFVPSDPKARPGKQEKNPGERPGGEERQMG